MNKLFLSGFLAIIIVKLVKPDCSLMQIGTKPLPAEGEKTKPREINTTTLNKMCPDFKDQKVCCDENQLATLVQNFKSLETIFGESVGGCDVCVVNLKRFWCYFTCAPNQAEFLKVFNYSKHIVGRNETRDLLDIDFYLDQDTNCDLFNSCKKTKFAAQVPSMANALGFVNFQGVNAYTKMSVFIKMKLDEKNNDTIKGLVFENDPCDTVPVDGKVRGYEAKNCTCNSCDKKCKYTSSANMDTFEGLNGVVIVLVYLGVLIGTIVLYFAKKLN